MARAVVGPMSLRGEWQPSLDLRPEDARLPADVVWHRVTAELGTHYGLPPSAIRGRSRLRSTAKARAHAYFELRDKYHRSWNEIGQASGRDHSTCILQAKAFARDAGIINWRG